MFKYAGSSPVTARSIMLSLVLTGVLVTFALPALADDQGVQRHPHWHSDASWITDVGTLLYSDSDRDGYFSGLSLTIDADSARREQEVYLTIDLVRQGQVIEPLHTTLDYSIYGSSFNNDYRLDIDLVRNYPSDRYDLLIGLRDADNSELLDQVGASQFRNLRQLPLESDDLDNVAIIPSSVAEDERPDTNADIQVDEYAASLDLWLLAMLSLSGVCAAAGRHRRNH